MKYFFTAILACILLNAGAQRPNEQPRNSNNLLNQSFWQAKPNAATVKAEVEKGSNPAEMNPMNNDAVVMAIMADAPLESIAYLLEQKGNSVDKLTHDGRTYLFWAAGRGNIPVMEHLIAKGAKANFEDSHGFTVVNFAANTGQKNTAVYDLCIKNGADLTKEKNHDGANALLLGVGYDSSLQLTQYFQSKGLDIKSKDANGSTAFDYAARAGNIGVMKQLLSKGVSFTNNAMLMAAQGGRRTGNSLEVYQYLEGLGIKPTVISPSGETVLHAIARRPGQTQIIQYFIGKGVNTNQVNDDGNNALMHAASANRDTATIAILASNTKNIDQANKKGATALALAVAGNAPEAVEYLLMRGANINTEDAKGNNLVYYLFESYNPRQAKEFEPKLKLLESKGLTITKPQKDGNTLYHLAVAKNDLSLVKLVQAYGVDVNTANKEGITALHKAAMIAKDNSIMQYLLSIGAKKDIKTSFDETAFQLASENEWLARQKVSVDFLK